MGDPLFSVFSLPVTDYALGMAGSVLLCSLLAARAARKAGYPARTVEVFLAAAIPLCLLLSRLFYVLIRLGFFLGWDGALALHFWKGGYSFWGLPPALSLALALAARLSKTKAAPLADRLVPYALLMLGLGRLCEGLAGQGFGQEAPPKLAFFPFAVLNEYGEWRFAVFFLEALGAMLVLLVLSRMPRREDGDRARLALAWYCAFQLVFESLRQDDVLTWGFVRASQVLAASTLLVLMTLRQLRLPKGTAARNRRFILRLSAFLLLVLLVAALEYAIDKTEININLIYALMTFASVALSALSYKTLAGGPGGPQPALKGTG